jgi:hypothetical protein
MKLFEFWRVHNVGRHCDTGAFCEALERGPLVSRMRPSFITELRV